MPDSHDATGSRAATINVGWYPCAHCKAGWRAEGEQVFAASRWFCSVDCFQSWQRRFPDA